MIKSSTGLAAYMMVTGSAKGALDLGFIRFYSGAEPATADAAVTGTLLWTVSVGGDGTGLTWDATAVGRAMVKPTAAAWSGATTAGEIGYFRISGASDVPGDISTTHPRIQGSVGSTAGSDFYMSNPTVTTDAALDAKTVANLSVALPTL